MHTVFGQPCLGGWKQTQRSNKLLKLLSPLAQHLAGCLLCLTPHHRLHTCSCQRQCSRSITASAVGPSSCWNSFPCPASGTASLTQNTQGALDASCTGMWQGFASCSHRDVGEQSNPRRMLAGGQQRRA